MIFWTEKYRPNILKDFICSEKINKTFQSYIDNQDIPGHLLLSGPAGTGKTSIAKLLSKQIKCDYQYINASEERNIDTLRTKIKDFAYYVGTEQIKICILDEADGMGIIAAQALRPIMEATSEHTRFILTCNYPQKIIDPIKSRCMLFEFKTFTKDQVVERLKLILNNEKVSYDIKELEEIARNTYPDIRKAINTTQRNVTSGKLSIDKSSFSYSVNVKILELILKKQFREMRKLCLEEGVVYESLYEFIFDEFAKNGMKFDDIKIGKILLIISDYLYKHSLVASPDINFAACALSIIDML